MSNKQNLINIVLVSLDEKFCKSVSSVLASKLDMFFASCKDLIEYDLINPKDVLDKCGIEYLKKREKGVVENCASYENTIIAINYDLFKDYFQLFSKSAIIYLAFPREKISNTISNIVFEKRDKFLSENANIKINIEKKLKVNTANKIIERLGELV